MTYQKRVSDNPNDPDYILRDGDVLKDGRVLRIGMMMMDGAMPSFIASPGVVDGVRHAPGWVRSSDSADDPRAQAYAEYEASLADAWRNPNPPPAEKVKDKPTGDARAAAIAAHDAWLTNAWRTA